MKSIHLIAAGALMMTAGAADARERLSPEAELAKITSGRIAGRPVDCINFRDIRSSTIVPGIGVVYRMTNGVVYVNRPAGGVSDLDTDAIMVTQTPSTRLCRIDIVQLIDRNSNIFSGSFGLGDFVPYTKPAKRSSTE